MAQGPSAVVQLSLLINHYQKIYYHQRQPQTH